MFVKGKYVTKTGMLQLTAVLWSIILLLAHVAFKKMMLKGKEPLQIVSHLLLE